MSAYDERTDAQKKTAARKHYLAALYHNVFMSPADRTQMPTIGVNVDAMTANKLVSNKMAMIHAYPQDDGSVVVRLGQTTTGSRLYDRNGHLYTKTPTILPSGERVGKVITLSQINRYSKTSPVNLSEVRDACMRLSPRMFTRWY